MDCTFAGFVATGSTTAQSSPAFCREAVSAGPVPSREAAAWLDACIFLIAGAAMRAGKVWV